MVFSSVEFLLYFFPVFFILYGVTPQKYKNITLLLGSLVFYAFGELKYLPVLLVSVAVNYFVGLHLGVGRRERRNWKKSKLRKRKRNLLAAAVAGNVGVLILFKGNASSWGLPLGISFYTFQILSYLIDVYRRDIRRESSFLKLATYITMFPQLISGPIVSYSEVSEALDKRIRTAESIQDGFKKFIAGLACKVLLADRVGLLWHEVTVTGFESISTPLAWLGAIVYSLKIYFDFYGYSLMAAGLGRMLGFELPQNFNLPYMATSVREFYRRWHITLGRWFRQYVYIPLGGSRKGEFRTAIHLLAVWALTSVWHGITPNFLIWGMILWICIVLERQAQKLGLGNKLKVLPHLYLWFVIPISWICFAITDLSQLEIYLGRMFGVVKGINVRDTDWLEALKDYWYLIAASMAACTPFAHKIYQKWKNKLPGMIVLAALFWVCLWRIIVEGDNPFMYSGF